RGDSRPLYEAAPGRGGTGGSHRERSRGGRVGPAARLRRGAERPGAPRHAGRGGDSPDPLDVEAAARSGPPGARGALPGTAAPSRGGCRPYKARRLGADLRAPAASRLRRCGLTPPYPRPSATSGPVPPLCNNRPIISAKREGWMRSAFDMSTLILAAITVV